MYVDPSPEQFKAFTNLPSDQAVLMLNLIKLNAKANYRDGTELTGAQAYATYGNESAKIFQSVGGEIIWRGQPESVLIGPSDENWDLAFIARYPSANAFMQMVMNPEYQAIVHHRQAAVEDSRLIRMGELESSAFFG